MNLKGISVHDENFEPAYASGKALHCYRPVLVKIFSRAPKLKLSLPRTFDGFTDGFSCLLGISYWP